jgi:hypothetical protein
MSEAKALNFVALIEMRSNSSSLERIKRSVLFTPSIHKMITCKDWDDVFSNLLFKSNFTL